MKLQLALDDISLDEAIQLVDKIEQYVDIIEVGSPFIIDEGMHAVKKLKNRFPNKQILADTKIVDAGDYEAELTYLAGVDYCTVIGMTDILTIKGCVEAANRYRKNVFVDMICVENLEARVKEIEDVGVNCIAVHVGVDQQAAGMTPLDSLKEIKKASKNSIISVAGGINENTAHLYKEAGADIVVVGGGINHADDPIEAARKIYEAIQ